VSTAAVAVVSPYRKLGPGARRVKVARFIDGIVVGQ